MKKGIVILLMMMACVFMVGYAIAEETGSSLPEPVEQNVIEYNVGQGKGSLIEENAEEETIGREIEEDTRADSQGASVGELVRFIPTTITIDDDDLIVRGYFINLNEDVAVQSFTNLEMLVFADGRQIADGTFEKVNDFVVEPLGVLFQGFRFTGEGAKYKNGTYICKDDDYCLTSFSFSTSKR